MVMRYGHMAKRKTSAFASREALVTARPIPVPRPIVPRRGRLPVLVTGLATLFAASAQSAASQEPERPRARDLGIAVGIFEPGRHNAITDVEGVLVGHATVIEGDDIRTGVTAIRPHGGNLYFDRVPAAMHVGNGFGKLLGVTQVGELGELETPVLLTCTLCVWRAADAMAQWALEMDGMEGVRSINPVVGETNDGGLNDIRGRPVTAAHVRAALEGAAAGPVEEGAVGAGTGTSAFGWKGGVGTSSRVLPAALGGYTVGVLVQSNFGGILRIAGAPVGRELGRYAFRAQVERGGGGAGGWGEGRGDGGEGRGREGREGGGREGEGREGEGREGEGREGEGREGEGREGRGREGEGREGGNREGVGLGLGEERDGEYQGSIMMVVATDAPLSERSLRRVAMRAVMGLSRTGSYASNGSGDYVIAFSTAAGVRRRPGEAVRTVEDLANNAISGIFQATVEATEEAIYNSIFRAVTVSSRFGTREALPIEATMEVLRRYGVVPG